MTLVWRWATKGANLQEFLVLVWRATGDCFRAMGQPPLKPVEWKSKLRRDGAADGGAEAKAGKKRFVVPLQVGPQV
ncbi:hypothetical protein V8C40DRAFT_244549 [Trichoderma camerunense]